MACRRASTCPTLPRKPTISVEHSSLLSSALAAQIPVGGLIEAGALPIVAGNESLPTDAASVTSLFGTVCAPQVPNHLQHNLPTKTLFCPSPSQPLCRSCPCGPEAVPIPPRTSLQNDQTRSPTMPEKEIRTCATSSLQMHYVADMSCGSCLALHSSLVVCVGQLHNLQYLRASDSEWLLSVFVGDADCVSNPISLIAGPGRG